MSKRASELGGSYGESDNVRCRFSKKYFPSLWNGKVIFNKRLKRNEFLKFVCQQPICVVGMEACSSSHYWARELVKLGYNAKLMAPQFVKPYVKTNKNHAAAICEAVTRPSMRFVDIKTETQQALLLLHRDRSGLIRDRTALVNRLRASMAEFGVIAPQGINKLREWLAHVNLHRYGAISLAA